MYIPARFPTQSNALCQFGDAFISEDQAVVTFLAGIGTNAGLTDVQELVKVN